MWLSKNIGKNRENQTAENATITLNSTDETEASGSAKVRNISTYTPFGYSCAVPSGEDVLLIPSCDGSTALGTKNIPSGLEPGEIKIQSAGGAFFVLKNDGSVIINSLTITPDGKIQEKGA